MNYDVLKKVKEINQQCADQLDKDFRIFQVNTSEGETRGDPERTAEVVAEAIDEDILSCSKDVVTNSFQDKNLISGHRSDQLLRQLRDGDFRPRDQVEKDTERVQALPIVLIRNSDGDVLRLRRREKTEDNPLHDEIVIWAGGHVRCEDAINGDPLIHCAIQGTRRGAAAPDNRFFSWPDWSSIF